MAPTVPQSAIVSDLIEQNDLPVMVAPRGPIQRLSVRFGGSNPKELERFLKFAVVGIIGFAIDLGTTNVLLATLLRPTSAADVSPERIATSIGFTLAVISNFIWNRYWTYPDSRSRPLLRQIAQFFAVNVVGLVIRFIILGLLVVPFGTIISSVLSTASSETVAKIATNGAVLVALGVVMLWNFFVNRRWTYSDVK